RVIGRQLEARGHASPSRAHARGRGEARRRASVARREGGGRMHSAISLSEVGWGMTAPSRRATEYDVVVVGAGPNGLGAGITTARAGLATLVVEMRDRPGGGARSTELTLPGFVHDPCSTVHPLGLASPFFRSLALERHGLVWVHPEAPLAHVLDEHTV